jgi:hypothetical protein
MRHGALETAAAEAVPAAVTAGRGVVKSDKNRCAGGDNGNDRGDDAEV